MHYEMGDEQKTAGEQGRRRQLKSTNRTADGNESRLNTRMAVEAQQFHEEQL